MDRPHALRSAPAASLERVRDGLQRWAYVTAIGLSAFLLFSLELLAGRRVLPVFGGAPAVWTTVLCFFTAVLFLGYLYAHVVAARLTLRAGGIVQLGVAAVAIGVAVFTPSQLGSLRWSEMPDALNVLVVLAVVAGGPALLLAATTPLLSSWYAGRGNDPWWLFAVSNGASFLALLAYPLIIEPSIGLSAQRGLLAAGLAAYAASLVPIVFFGTRQAAAPAAHADERSAAALAVRRQAIWLFAALVPAGLLSATTNFLQTDLISAPLIWIGPLGIYLASFVVAFADRGRPIVRACNWLVPAAATLLWVPFVKLHEGWPPIPLFVIELGALFVLAVAIHGRLAQDRPDSRLLTRFYLIVTAGGALGTAFVAMVAPLIFSTIYEYPLLIIGGLVVLALLPDVTAAPSTRSRVRTESFAAARRLLPYAAIAGALYLLLHTQEPTTAANVRNVLFLGGIVVVAAITPKTLAVVAPITLAFLIAVNATSPLVRTRTFFGVIEVRQGNSVHTEFSGTTLHGLQFTDAHGAEPSTYYSRVGPLGSVFGDLRTRTSGARIGVVGLGVGTIAAYAQLGDQMTFYEINPAVVDIARNPAYFTYLSGAAVKPIIVVGDARLSLDDQPSSSFDLLVLDAFSSDTVPAHLLTREAMQTYIRTLRPGGVLAFHLSNRYYNLALPVAATARADGLTTMLLRSNVSEAAAKQFGASDSLWLVAGASGDIAAFSARGWANTPLGGYVLTDDYSDLTRSLDLSGF
jgi:SAM-dependent methyltransferase